MIFMTFQLLKSFGYMNIGGYKMNTTNCNEYTACDFCPDKDNCEENRK